MKHNDERFEHAQLGGGNSLWWRQLDTCGLISSLHLFRIARMFTRLIASGKTLLARLIGKITEKRTLFKFHSRVANTKWHLKSQNSKNNFWELKMSLHTELTSPTCRRHGRRISGGFHIADKQPSQASTWGIVNDLNSFSTYEELNKSSIPTILPSRNRIGLPPPLFCLKLSRKHRKIIFTFGERFPSRQ